MQILRGPGLACGYLFKISKAWELNWPGLSQNCSSHSRLRENKRNERRQRKGKHHHPDTSSVSSPGRCTQGSQSSALFPYARWGSRSEASRWTWALICQLGRSLLLMPTVFSQMPSKICLNKNVKHSWFLKLCRASEVISTAETTS